MTWHFWIDRGGTFTDIVARRPDGVLVTAKLLSEDPEHYDDSAFAGIARLLGLAPGEPIPEGMVTEVRMGTTVATNALLERNGAPVVLAITAGLGDVLRIGTQARPRLFDRALHRQEPLYSRVIEVPERVDAQGGIVRPLDEEAARRDLRAAYDEGFRAIAIVLMHGWRYPAHELRMAELAREAGFLQISVSHQVSPLMKIVPRGDTAVAEAYVTPVLRRHLDRLAARLPGTRLLFMQSNGGLADQAAARGKDALLSGPAGGVVGAARTSEAAGFSRIIGFDMGGTSTDVCRYDGAYEREFETEIAGIRVRAPMMRVNSVAAGGGSILHYDGLRFRVGPDSAGANPGPACYRKGGPLTITDCNVMVGKLQPRFFPSLFGPGGNEPPDIEVVQRGFAELAAQIGGGRDPRAVAEGFLAIAVENMANAIKRISIERGHDLADTALACFGGAGGQHACLVADALGMATVLIHPLAGVLSAYGIGLADLRALNEAAIEAPLDGALMSRLAALAAELEQAGRAELDRQGLAGAPVAVEARLLVRVRGSDSALEVPLLSGREEIEAEFLRLHRARFGFADPGGVLVIQSIAVEVAGGGNRPAPPSPPTRHTPLRPLAEIEIFAEGEPHRAPVFDRASLATGDKIAGPAMLLDANATTIVEPGWEARLDGQGCLILRRTLPHAVRQAAGTAVDPVMLEVFGNRFMAIAERMGAVLANTAHSVNIKERLDFSCALFDRDGNLIANAPHIPVHLGSMSDAVRAVIRTHAPAMEPGDSFVLNDPADGGTHLPDVTVVTPFFHAGKPLFFLGARGHHADIGGITPGSMPPSSRTLGEEGVVLANLRLVHRGHLDEAGIRAVLGSGPHPARNLDQNLADLRGQLAATRQGAAELEALVAQQGEETVLAYVGHVQANAKECVRRVIAGLSDGAFAVEMDDGAVIRVAVTIDRARGAARLDFTGTSAQRPGNTNAPMAVGKAAALYVFRCLVDDPIPLNEGCLAPLELILPEGSMLNPARGAAVVGGNVETSQAMVDCLMGALGVMAACQGTMNNFTFGDATRQYYETLCGGAGAGPGFDGASAIHTHMTNSRLTDPELLEWRFPVRLERFSIRNGSGGAGFWHGGEGVERHIRFLAPMTAAILSNRRRIAPFGLAGGGAASPGRNRIMRADGGVEELAGTAQTEMATGDVFVVVTPGGGGFGVGDDDD